MLNEKMSFLIKFLGTSNKEIASYANCSPSNFSRLKSGKRAIQNDSVTVYRFSRGIYLYSAHNSKLDHLCDVIHCKNSGEEEVISKLSEWLFQEKSLSEGELSKDVSPMVFGQRVRQLMSLVNISSSKLSKKLNVDPSYISRMRNGERIPKYNSKIMSKFCKYAVSMICEQGKLEELNKITEMELTSYSESEVTEVVKNYLYSVKFPGIVLPVKELIENINGLTVRYPDNMPAPDPEQYNGLLSETEEKYSGQEGLQRAVLRLLANAVDSGKEMLLYSDQNMDWLYGEYKEQWLCFMWECVKKGIKFKIIHNLDRSAEELIYAMKIWFPLYLTGMISSYCCVSPAGLRFVNTVFINSGNSCIEGHCVKGTENDAEYFYITDKEHLKHIEKEFDVLMQNCKPLVLISSDQRETEQPELYQYGDLHIAVNERTVKIERTENPILSFSFDHPVICKAFAEFIKTVNKK